MAELRSAAQRKADVLALLEQHRHGWLATATRDGTPHLVVVATVWNDGATILITTRRSSRTGQNLEHGGRGRIALGSSNDAIMIDVDVEQILPVVNAGRLGQVFVAAVGWDPADEGPDWCYFVLRPTRVQAYRGYGELAGREIMRRGRWLV
jgi:predicted pyridoxine 5'-phosphate oxidase superfamily flavin-nucleotide-binding protein